MLQKKPFGRAKPAAATGEMLRPAPERRSSRRRLRNPDAGKLAFGLGTPGVDCTIVDASETGAKVLIGIDPLQVPNDVVLIYLRKHLAYEAAVVRKTEKHVALKFTSVLDLNNPTTPELEAMRRQCGE